MKRPMGTLAKPPRATVLPLRKCIFVSDFNVICGNDTNENSLLDWCVANSIESLFLYDLSSVLSSSYTSLAAFYTKALSRNIKLLYGQRGSEYRLIGTPFNSSKNYNLANPTKRIQAGFENEFWNYALTGPDSNQMIGPGVGNKDFPDAKGRVIYRHWIEQQKNIYAYNKSVGLKSELYIGHLHDYVENTPSLEIAKDMIKYSDAIHLSWYVTTSEFNSSDAGLNYVSERLNYLGEAGIALGTKANIVLIFAGTAEYMKDYFVSGKTLLNAFNRALNSYNTNSGGIITKKSGIYLAGYNGYSIDR